MMTPMASLEWEVEPSLGEEAEVEAVPLRPVRPRWLQRARATVLCTAYIPPLYRWATLVFMRRREYV
jgi:hypothetical protein